MSFSKTISVFAALASIFGAGAAGWKLSQESQPQVVQPVQNDISVFQEKINQLEKQLEEVKEPPKEEKTNPVVVQKSQQTPDFSNLPPLPPVPEPKPGEFE